MFCAAGQLRFIKHKLKNAPNDHVLNDADGNPMTLRAVFQALGLNAYDLSIDMLDMYVRTPAVYVCVCLRACVCVCLLLAKVRA